MLSDACAAAWYDAVRCVLQVDKPVSVAGFALRTLRSLLSRQPLLLIDDDSHHNNGQINVSKLSARVIIMPLIDNGGC